MPDFKWLKYKEISDLDMLYPRNGTITESAISQLWDIVKR